MLANRHPFRRRPPVWLLALVVGACRTPSPAAPVAPPPPPPPPAEDFRAQIPAAQPVAPLRLPPTPRRLLANGLQLLVTPKPGLPLVTAQLVVRSGTAQDPPDLPGLAGFMAGVLRAGTDKRSAHAIAEQVEALGTSIDISVDEDATIIGITCLKEHFDKVFSILADVCLHPRFAPEEIERKRKLILGRIRQGEDEPSYVASHIFRRALYGKHPYGHLGLGDQAAIARVRRADLVSHWRTHIQPGNAALVMAGDISEDEGWAAAQRGFGLWHGSAKSQPGPIEPQGLAPDVRLVDRPASTQSSLVVGLLGAARKDPDFYALNLLNSILGGAFNSRINMNLREDKGYTYGAFSHFNFSRARGPFAIATRVRSDVTAAALHEILAEVEGIRAKDVSAEELRDAKNRYILSMPATLQTVGGLADRVSGLYVYDLPLDELSRLPESIEKVSVQDVRQLAQRYLDPEHMHIVVVGDAASVGDSLQALGRGQVQMTLVNGDLAASPKP